MSIAPCTFAVRSPRRLVLLLAVATLSGCGFDSGVTIPAGWESLERCETSPTPLSLDALQELGRPGCDLAGTTLLLSDGHTITVRGVGNVETSNFDALAMPEVEWTSTNWGLPGVAVVRSVDGDRTDLWASTDEAEELMLEGE